MAYCGLEIFWHRPSQEPPVSLEDWIQIFQLIVIAKEETDIEDLLQDNVLPDNPHPTRRSHQEQRTKGEKGMRDEKDRGNNAMARRGATEGGR